MKIGIDPDIDKSGVAVITEKGEVVLYTLPFFSLIDFLKLNQNQIKEVAIECGYLNAKSNFHYRGAKTGISAKIGALVGANHQISRLLVQYCQHNHINHREVKPLKKHWKGANGKITHNELTKIVKYDLPKRTNQEQRDALLLIL